MSDIDDRPRSSSGHGGIYAILVVIVILLVGGFLYFTRYADDGPDIELEVPAPEGPDVDVPDVEVPEPDGGGNG